MILPSGAGNSPARNEAGILDAAPPTKQGVIMKTWLFALASAVLLVGCSSMEDRDTGSGMGSSAPVSSGSMNSNPTGIGSSSTGQPYGANPSGTGTR